MKSARSTVERAGRRRALAAYRAPDEVLNLLWPQGMVLGACPLIGYKFWSDHRGIRPGPQTRRRKFLPSAHEEMANVLLLPPAAMLVLGSTSSCIYTRGGCDYTASPMESLQDMVVTCLDTDVHASSCPVHSTSTSCRSHSCHSVRAGDIILIGGPTSAMRL
ncbi:hypothetical protein EXIGLDRAFT_721558 [Exidia glandulosa HHB12029]|uniref:Uncharacterized protein n=1 Tax=Exidia glandulosa HHB12029 TaxID=1314781 RepID=A0A165FMI5_EXIGL|nr:hypothetical protein EXIGLDRAFT_721558 [Exidia glandulosa HHB12029]